MESDGGSRLVRTVSEEHGNVAPANANCNDGVATLDTSAIASDGPGTDSDEDSDHTLRSERGRISAGGIRVGMLVENTGMFLPSEIRETVLSLCNRIVEQTLMKMPADKVVVRRVDQKDLDPGAKDEGLELLVYSLVCMSVCVCVCGFPASQLPVGDQEVIVASAIEVRDRPQRGYLLSVRLFSPRRPYGHCLLLARIEPSVVPAVTPALKKAMGRAAQVCLQQWSSIAGCVTESHFPLWTSFAADRRADFEHYCMLLFRIFLEHGAIVAFDFKVKFSCPEFRSSVILSFSTQPLAAFLFHVSSPPLKLCSAKR